ncbi:MAG: class I SAM-dependent methyltransferase [Spongiibacteraceae bacterium]
MQAVDTNKDNIPVSALYTSATWHWGKLPCAELVMPHGATTLFRAVNFYMVLYRWLNPKKYSLQHTLLHRHTAINRLLATAACPHVIEIAAGFSPRGSMISEDPSIDYIEVDLPEVIDLKRKQLLSSADGKRVLVRKNFKLQPGDITQLDFSTFEQQPSFVITEGLMMYFDRDRQLSIWRNIANHIKTCGGEYVFDYIPLDVEPKRSFFGKFFSAIRSLLLKPTYAYDERTRVQIADDLRTAGFSRVDIFSSAKIAREWGLPQNDIPTEVIIYRCSRG